MILRVWLKIFLIVFCVSVPLIWIQYLSQRESIELALALTDRVSPVQFLDSHLQLLKKVSKLEPKQADQYRKEFESVLELKFAKQDLHLVKGQLVHNLLRETLRNAIVVLAVFLILSFLISRNMVFSFQALVDQIQEQSKRLERLNSIESWQRIARVLVHELRAPITPIKLVSTDIEQKYKTLNSDSFRFYLSEGAKLIQSQVQSIETLLESFTRFAKLPEIKRTRQSVVEALNRFVGQYSGYNNGQVELRLVVQSIINEDLYIDSIALNHLFFNLIKNASEANPNSSVLVLMTLIQDPEKTWIQVRNSGNSIPNEIAEKMFDLHVSSKSTEQLNLGIGLTISRKIALDHEGDLYLLTNTADSVTFELELPNL